MYHITATELPRKMQCSGSDLIARLPIPQDDDTTLRDEGNAWHWLAEQLYRNIPVSVGTVAPNAIVISADMIDHAAEYISKFHPGEMERITTWALPEVFQIDGRADHIGFDELSQTLHVTDGKYGYGLVEPENNWTLISHALGYVLTTGLVPDFVTLTIFQPRAYHPLGSRRSWTFTYETLLEFYDRISVVLKKQEATLHTGSQCRKCLARYDCPAYRAASMNAIDATSHAYNDNLSADALAREIELLRYAGKMITDRTKAIEELAQFRISNGDVIPGWGIDKPKGQTRYRKGVTPDLVQALTGRDIAERKMPTVSNLRNMGIATTIIESITERPEGSARLVRVDTDAMARHKLGVN